MDAQSRESSSFKIHRRCFMGTSGALVTSLVASRESSAAEAGVLLRPSGQQLFRVRTKLEVKGNVNVPKNPLATRETGAQLPMNSSADFDYEERFLAPEGADFKGTVVCAERYYHLANSQTVLNRNTVEAELRESVRYCIVRRERTPEVIYSPEDLFRNSELDLLRSPASSIAVDQLLPTQVVSEGDQYKPSDEVIESVFNLSSVDSSDLLVSVVSIASDEAKLEFQGETRGSVDGVSTIIRSIGKLTFDRAAGTCTWLAMGLHETREAGKAEPGFDVSATLRMLRKPLADPVGLPAVQAVIDFGRPVPSQQMYVDLSSENLGFSALMDRRWRMMSDVAGSAMMRMTSQDRSIAQCDFRPLETLKPEDEWTLEALENDVRQTLGEQLSELVESDQRLTESGLRVMRVAASGQVQDVPISWIVMHFSDRDGRRLLATFTMEADHRDRFAGADIQLADSLSFLAPKPLVEESAAGPASGDGRVASSKSADFSGDSISSASDLK